MDTMKLWNSVESAGTGKAEDDFAPFMEISLLPGDAPRGAVVVFPGGGYCNRAPHEGMPVAKAFNAQGFHAFVVQYRVAPYCYPAPQRDAFRAIKLIRQHAAEWGVIPDQIATLGFSAGGHLCASTATLFDVVDANAGDGADVFSARPDAVIPCYPVINITDSWGHIGSGRNLLGADYEAKGASLNLDKLVSAQSPAAFLWHTADDGCVNVANSLRYAEAMWKLGLKTELHVFPHGSHGLGLAPDFSDIRVWPELAGRFLVATCGFTAVRA